jgi:hypothetical protein
MVMTSLSVALLLAALAGGWLCFTRDGALDGRGALARCALVGLAFVGHLNLLDLRPDGALVARIPATHVHETLHYYVGTRYFAELGYTGLYHAVVLADFEDDPSGFRREASMRDLATGAIQPRSLALERAREIRARFSPERWSAFKRDVAFHRDASSEGAWRRAVIDQGYNGTPLVTLLLGAVASQPLLPSRALLPWVGLLDLLLIGAFAAWVALRASPAAGLAFLFFSFANPLNDFTFIGASYLRYAYFLALAGACFALGRERLATAGALLAVAGGLRLFPLALYGGLLVRDLAQRDWRERLREGRRLHGGFALAVLAIAVSTSLLPTPDGLNPWRAFAAKIGAHASGVGINHVSLPVALSYSRERERLHGSVGVGYQSVSESSGAGPDWASETRRARRDLAIPLGIASALGLALAFLAVRRGDRAASLLPSLLAVFCVLPMTHYYWAMLSLLPLAMPGDVRLRRGLLVLFAALALTSAHDLFQGYVDLRFALKSAALGLFLVLGCVAIWRGGAPPARPAPTR